MVEFNMAANGPRHCEHCGGMFEKNSYYKHSPCYSEAGVKKPGDSNPLQPDVILQNNATLPGDVGVTYGYPSLDEDCFPPPAVGIECKPLIPPKLPDRHDNQEHVSESSKGSKPSMTVDSVDLGSITWEQKLQEVDQIYSQIQEKEQTSESLLKCINQLKEELEKLKGDLFDELRGLESEAETLQIQITGQLKQFFEEKEKEKLREEMNMKMMNYTQLDEKIEKLKNLLNQRFNKLSPDAVKAELQKELKCIICHDLMKYPRMLLKCTHIFCCDCIIKWHRFQSRCPVCRAGFEIQAAVLDKVPSGGATGGENPFPDFGDGEHPELL